MFTERVKKSLQDHGYNYTETSQNSKSRHFDKWVKIVPETANLPETCLTVFVYKSMEDPNRIVSYKLEGLAKPFLTANLGSMRAKVILRSFDSQEMCVLNTLQMLNQILRVAEAEARAAGYGNSQHRPYRAKTPDRT